MKFKLNAKDRLIIPNVLPQEGTMVEQTIAKEIIDMIRINSKEFAKYGITDNPAKDVCPYCRRPVPGLEGLDAEKNPKILQETEFDFSKLQTDTMKDAVEKKDNDKKVNQAILETCQKIKEMR